MSVNTDQPADCLWQEISQGIFRRSMIPFECFFNPEMGWSVWASIKLGSIPNAPNNKEELMDRVRRAWIRVLYEQPQLASIFDFQGRTCTYTTTTEQSLAIWLDETFIVADDPYNSVATRGKPILCLDPSTRELLFRAPHCYIDGIGTILLLADIVSHLNNPQPTTFGDEAKNFSPIFDIAANVPAPQAPNHECSTQLTSKFLESQPSIGLPFYEGPSTGHSVSEISLSLEDSNALVSTCKTRGLTVTHAVHAALVQTTVELNPKEEAKFYTSMPIYNWRGRVRAEYQRCRAALYCGAFPMAIRDPGVRDFDDIAEEMKRMYVDTNQDEEIAKAHSLWWSELLTALRIASDQPPATTPLLSSLGVIERVLPEVVGGVKIKDFKFGIDIKGPIVTAYLWNWGGRVSLCAAWDRGSFEEGDIDEFLKRLVQKLAAPLGLSLN